MALTVHQRKQELHLPVFLISPYRNLAEILQVDDALHTQPTQNPNLCSLLFNIMSLTVKEIHLFSYL